MNFSCGHEPITKVIRFSISGQDPVDEKLEAGHDVGIISCCSLCWENLSTVFNAAKLPENDDKKYFDGLGIVRILDKEAKSDIEVDE